MDVLLNLPKKDMKGDTVYLLYDTNASNIKLESKAVQDKDEDNVWEYVDKDKFTIMYNPDDIRKSTEIKILSKTKLRSRPKSADFVTKRDKGPLRGIIIKRSNSLSTIEEIFLMRHTPLIKPLLSEAEIMRLQNFQKECRMKRKDFRLIEKSDGEDEISKQKDSFPTKFGEDGGLIWAEDEKLKKMRDSPLVEPKGKKRRKSPDEESDVQRKVKKPDKEPKEKQGKKPKTPITPTSQKTIKTPKTEKKIDLQRKSKEQTSEKKKKEKLSSAVTNKSKKEKSASESRKSKTKTAKSDSESPISSKKLSSKAEKPKREKKSIEGGIESSKSKEKRSQERSKKKDYSDDSGETSKKSSKHKAKSQPTSHEDFTKKDLSKVSVGKSNKSKSSTLGDSKGSKKSSKEKKMDHDEEDEEGFKTSSKSQKDKSKKSVNLKSKAGEEEGELTKDPSKKKKEESDGKQTVKFAKGSFLEKSLDTTPKKLSKQPFLHYIIHYVLSNPLFIKLGWTLGPRDRDQVQVVTFKSYPANPKTYCFRERNQEELKYYSVPEGKVAYNFLTDGTGVIYYYSGFPAATITKHENGMRLTLYSEPKNDPLIVDSFKSKVLGVFDSSGNGVIYDMQGKKILNYNQLEGIYYCPLRNSAYKWQWCDYKILDRQRLKALLRFMAKDQRRSILETEKKTEKGGTPSKKTAQKEPAPVEEKLKKTQSDEMYEQILAELPHPEPRKFKVKSENQFWGFKPITLKINDELTLRINGQDNVVINFSSSKIFHRIDLGVKVDPDIVERIELLDIAKVTEVPCVFDGLLDLSPSLVKLNKKVSQSVNENTTVVHPTNKNQK